MEMILEIKNFTQKYNDKVAVDNLSLSVEKGEIFGFIGHNGAGKSTTIKSIVGILPVGKGAISSKRTICQKMCAYVPDNPDLYEYMTGIGYINFIADIFRVPEQERRERTLRFADEFEITEQLGNLISSYSHGMKQKVALIAAFVHNPKLLVLDEPFVGLDPKAAASLKKCMREHCEQGNAIFFSTHVLEVAQVLCDKVGMIDHGKLVEFGKVSELTREKSLEDIFLSRLEEKHA